MKIYQTVKGDTKEKILKKVAGNDFSIDHLKLVSNQLIHLPIRTSEGLILREYYTKANDTLYQILADAAIPNVELLYFNPIETLYLESGQRIPLHDVDKGIDEKTQPFIDA